MREVKICTVCGKKFIATRTNAKYCDAKCLKIGTAETSKIAKEKLKTKKDAERAKQNRKKESLASIAVAARQAGMTYGQYVAKMGL